MTMPIESTEKRANTGKTSANTTSSASSGAASATLARPVPGVWVTATRIHHVNGFSNVRIYLNRPTDKATRFLVSFYSR